MFKKIFLVGASVATLAGAALTTAGPAAADSTHWYGDAGYGQFFSSGASLWACDRKGDGYGIVVPWQSVENPANQGVVADHNGAGTCVGVGTGIVRNHHVSYQVCISNNGVTLGCVGPFQDVAS